jgi:hypothetical protein
MLIKPMTSAEQRQSSNLNHQQNQGLGRGRGLKNVELPPKWKYQVAVG